jgi:O-acetyl-ADP-ribose deacetylase (regulator of RNase III)
VPTLRALQADITALEVDAIANAANERLLGGGGVDGAIHRAAGPALLDACRALDQVRPGVRCPTGEARITPGFDLPARWVVHTVGPVWGAQPDSDSHHLLASCYRACLRLAAGVGARSIAFPCVSTGVYGYPPDRAARVAVETVREAAPAAASIEDVVFACFSAADLALYASLLRA